MNEDKNICPACQQVVSKEDNFCPNCGQELKEKEVNISVLAQVGLYLFAIFLPPWGLWPGIKYFKKKDKNAKRVGVIILIITIVSSVIMIWEIFVLFDMYLDLLNSIV